MDDIARSPEPGSYADLVLLEQDPAQVNPTEIENINVTETRLT